MATRLYFPSAGTPDASPAFDAAWTVSTNATHIKGPVLTPSDTAFATASDVTTTSTTIRDTIIFDQWVSDPITAGTVFAVTDTVKGVVRVSENSTSANFIAAISIRVVSNDGTTVRATLMAVYAGTQATPEFATVLTNRYYPRLATSAAPIVLEAGYTTVSGDRLVVEMGAKGSELVATVFTATGEFGDPIASSDLADDATSTTQGRPWLEFSNTFTFAAAAEAPAPELVMAPMAAR